MLTGHHLLQRAQVHARDARHLAGLYCRRHAQVYHDQRPSAPRRGHRPERGLRDDVHRRIHRAEDDVGIGQRVGQRIERDALGGDGGGHCIGAVAGAIGHHQPLHTHRPEVAGHLHAGRTGADDHDVAVGQRHVTPDQLHRRRRHRLRPHPEGGLGPDEAAGAQGRLHHAAQEPADAGGRVERRPHLAQDLGFAEDQRLQAGADAKQDAWRRRCRTGSRSSAANRRRPGRTPASRRRRRGRPASASRPPPDCRWPARTTRCRRPRA